MEEVIKNNNNTNNTNNKNNYLKKKMDDRSANYVQVYTTIWCLLENEVKEFDTLYRRLV